VRRSPATRPATYFRSRGRRSDPPGLLFVVSGERSLFDLGRDALDAIEVPLFEKHFGLPAKRELVREILHELALRSKLRGAGRFCLLSAAFARLRALGCAGFAPLRETAAQLEAWLRTTGQATTAGLAGTLVREPGAARRLGRVLAWSRDLDRGYLGWGACSLREACVEVLRGLPRQVELVVAASLPAPLVAKAFREGLPTRFPHRIWESGGVDRITLLAGHVGLSRALSQEELGSQPRHRGERILVIGDSLHDLSLARSLGARFHPLVPGREESGWASLGGTSLSTFIAGGIPSSGELGRFLGAFREPLSGSGASPRPGLEPPR